MKPIKVLQFITPSGFYGAERWVLALANNLNPGVVSCDLAVTKESSSQDLSVAEYYPREAGAVHVLPMHGSFDWSIIGALADLLERENIDVLHTHGYKSDIIGLFAARRAGVACVSTPHGYPAKAGLKMGLYIRAGAMALKRFDKVVPLSTQLLSDLKRFRIPEARMQFIENGVDLTELENQRKPIRASSSSAHIGYVGQLIPRKGIRDLIALFDRICQRFPDARLSIVGGGSERAALEAYAGSLPCSSNIDFLGFRSDRLSLIRDFDAFIMTSSLEGIPRCLMEAMAIGTPVLAYDIEGVDQLIDHNETGLLAPLGNWQTLAEQVVRLLEEDTLAERIARQARERVDTRFSAKRMAEEYEALFKRLVDIEASGLPNESLDEMR